jgi:Domain of unknown function (DUF1737)
MEYVVVEEFDPEAMSERVELLLNDGWELQGDIQIVAYYAKDDEIEHRTIFVQALTKKDKPTGSLSMGSVKTKLPGD